MTGYDIKSMPLIVGAIIEAQKQIANNEAVKDVFQKHFDDFVKEHPIPDSIIEDFEWANKEDIDDTPLEQDGDVND